MAVSQPIGPLPPDTLFQFRLVATNSGGETKSKEVFFTTPGEAVTELPPAKSISVQSVSVRGTTASIELSAPDLGLISAAGRDLREASRVSYAAGPVKLSLSLTSAGIRQLKRERRHQLKLPVQITFLPFQSGGGKAQKASAKLVFRTGT